MFTIAIMRCSKNMLVGMSIMVCFAIFWISECANIEWRLESMVESGIAC